MLPGRTTETLVRGIIDTIATVSLNPYIDIANELVTEKCAVVFPGTVEALSSDGYPVFTPAPGGFTYSAYRLELIERWLAAHFYTVFDPRSEEERAETVAQRLQGKVAKGLDSSLYGQNAMRLDTMGALAVMNNADNQYAKVPPAVLQGVNIGATWLGRKCRSRGWGGGWFTGAWG